MKHVGNLFIRTNEDAKKYAGLTEVTGDLFIYSEATLEAPKLESVGGALFINSKARLEAPELKSVGGDLTINSEARLEAPKLESVGGALFINSKAKLPIGVRTMKNYTFNWKTASDCDASMPMRFFIYDPEAENGEGGFIETDVHRFEEAEGEVTWERHSIHQNGVMQICLTKMPKG